MDSQDVEAARAVALRFLGYAARSRAEIERRLQRAKFAPDVIAAVVAEMETRGWLNDTQFARAWVEDRADRKRYGKARLADELQRKGVDREVVEETLANGNDADELARALAAAHLRWHPERLADVDPETLKAEKRKLANFLQRRGFAWDIITQVFAELTANHD